MVGPSRKAFLGRLLGASDARARREDPATAPVTLRTTGLEGSLAVHGVGDAAGRSDVRAHDVLAAVQAAKVVAA